MTSFIKRLFGGSKEKRAQELYAKLTVQITAATQQLIENALANNNFSLVQLGGLGGSNLTASLSPQGVAHLANNPPSSITDILQKEDPEIVAGAAAIAEVLVKNPSIGGGLSLNPAVSEITSIILHNELRRRFPDWPS